MSCELAAPWWVTACTLLACGWTGIDQSAILHGVNFRGLNAGTTNSSLDRIIPVRGIVYGLTGYMSRRYCPVSARNVQTFK